MIRQAALVAAASGMLAASACGGQEEPSERLSKRAAVDRIEGICERMLDRVEAVGPEPPIRAGSPEEVERFTEWQDRVLGLTETGLREIERVPVPDDPSRRYLRAYLRQAHGVIEAQRDLADAAEDGDDLLADGLHSRRESGVRLAGQAATRYGLSECGGSAP